jgi:hypothetical protein
VWCVVHSPLSCLGASIVEGEGGLVQQVPFPPHIPLRTRFPHKRELLYPLLMGRHVTQPVT